MKSEKIENRRKKIHLSIFTIFHPMLSSAASVMALATLTSNAQNLAQNGQTSGTPTTPPDSKTNSISQFALDRFAGKNSNITIRVIFTKIT